MKIIECAAYRGIMLLVVVAAMLGSLVCGKQIETVLQTIATVVCEGPMLAEALLMVAGGWAILLCGLDWKHRTLPNWLTLGGAGVALLVRGGGQGMSGMLDGFAAGAVAGTFLLLPFLMRGAGGGDVKMLFAAGTMAGWSRVLELLLYMSLAGLVLAVVMLALNRADGARLKHYGRCLVDWRYDRKAGAANLPPKDSARVRVPFGIAIGVGLILALIAKP